MLIPISTDAPLYHRPIGVIGLIVTNIATFVATSGGADPEGWLLRFGAGWHPVEWVLSAFLHFGPMHLIGNMIFLWAYGLIIEGKLGTVRFLSLYLAMCALDGCLCQTLMLANDSVGGAGGASGVIFALIAIALLWAPYNTFQTLIFYRFGIWGHGNLLDISVMALSGIYLGWNLLTATLAGFAMSTPVLHLLGAAVGLPIGWLFLHREWVDCEGWDLLSRWGDEQQPFIDGKFSSNTAGGQSGVVPAAVIRSTPTQLAARFQKLAGNQQYEAAARVAIELKASGGNFTHDDRKALRECINALKEQKLWKELATVLREVYLPLKLPDIDRARVMLGDVLSTHLQQPKAALKVLSEINPDQIDKATTAQLHRIRKQASQQLEEGVMEIRVE